MLPPTHDKMASEGAPKNARQLKKKKGGGNLKYLVYC